MRAVGTAEPLASAPVFLGRRVVLASQARPVDTDRIETSGWWYRGRSTLSTSITAAVFVGLFALTNALLRLPPLAFREVWFTWASTDLVNLAQHPVGSMVLSAFVDDSNIWDWIALGTIGLVAAGQTIGNLRCLVLVSVAHVVGTVVSEGILHVQIAEGRAPTAARISLDIGPSYVVVAALTVGIVYGGWPARICSLVGFVPLAPHLFGGIQHLEVGPVGHSWAILTGLVLGFFFRRAWRHRSPQVRATAAP